jgi:hypothetical protein
MTMLASQRLPKRGFLERYEQPLALLGMRGDDLSV